MGASRDGAFRLTRASDRSIAVIEPGGASRRYWSDLWRYRELLLILAWRDITVRYKQTVIGVAWALLRPLATAALFAFVFGRLANMPSDGGAPYVAFVLAAMAPWFLMSTIVSEGADSLISNSALIGKVYFPRLILPAAPIGAALVDFAITLIVLLAAMIAAGRTPDWRALALPLFVALALLVAIGPALLLATLNAKYRDFRYLLPFLLQFGLYLSPVGFSSAVIPQQWRFVYDLNPVVGVIDGFRWSLLAGDSPFNRQSVGLSALIGALGAVLGVRAFRRSERGLADIL